MPCRDISSDLNSTKEKYYSFVNWEQEESMGRLLITKKTKITFLQSSKTKQKDITYKETEMDRSKEYTERGNSTQKEHTSSSLCDDERDTIELNLVDDSSFMLPHRQRLHRRCHGLTLEKKKVVSDVSKYIYTYTCFCVCIYIHIHTV